MSDPYMDRARKRTKINFGAAEGRRRPGEAQARQESEILGLGAGLAPVAGGVLGGALGLAGGNPVAGAAIGTGIGQMAGAGLGYAADKRTEDYDEDEMKRRARMDAISRFLLSGG